MSTSFKPSGYTSVAPYLVVNGAGATMDFLVTAFGAEELRRIPADDGKVLHAELRLDDTVIMLADGTASWPPVPAHVHFYVPDVDATFRRALEAGAQSVQEPGRRDDENRRGAVKDAGGTTWWISTRIE